MSIASRITEMETHIGNAYTSIDNLGIDISNTNKNIYNISPLLDTFYESLPKVSGIGASLSLSPTMVGKIKLNGLYGNTSQTGTPTPDSPVPIESVTGNQNVEICGKNIFNGEIRQGNQNYTTTSARLFSNKNDWYFTSGTKLTFSTDLPNTFKVCFYLAKKPYLSEQYTAMQNFSYFSNGEQNITLTADGYLGFTIAKNDETAITPSDVANYHFQIEYGETKSSYKQYNGNTYEVNLGNIELNKIGDYEDSIKKSTGKNLFDKSTITTCAYLKEDGTLLTGTGQAYITSDFIPVKPNTIYYKTLTLSPRTKFYDSNKQPLNTTTYQDVSIGGNAGSFTTPNNAYYFRFTGNVNTSTGININLTMINEGSTALPYEPYGKVWYRKKNIGEYVLDSTKNWYINGTNNYQVSLGGNDRINLKQSATGLSNYFRVSNSGSDIFMWPILQGSTDYIRIVNAINKWETIEDFKTFISNNNIELVYPLATPEYEVITNTELIEQLETLSKAKSKNGTTNINVTSEDLAMILNVSVLKGDA